MTIERRTATECVELRAEGDTPTASGYAATFNRLLSTPIHTRGRHNPFPPLGLEALPILRTPFDSTEHRQ
jgi:hypothetical protein